MPMIVRAQAANANDLRPWIDAYYADHAAMSAAPTGSATGRWLGRYAPFVFFEDPTLADPSGSHRLVAIASSSDETMTVIPDGLHGLLDDTVGPEVVRIICRCWRNA